MQEYVFRNVDVHNLMRMDQNIVRVVISIHAHRYGWYC